MSVSPCIAVSVSSPSWHSWSEVRAAHWRVSGLQKPVWQSELTSHVEKMQDAKPIGCPNALALVI